jgi:hypothetical protein
MLATIAIVLSALATGSEERAGEVEFPAADYRGLPQIPREGVLVGTNYTHYAFEHCSWRGTGIISEYDRRDVRGIVHRQLLAMRRRGVGSLRLILWHMTDPGPNNWGPVPSRGGKLGEPYRENLKDYLREVRRFGFRRLTISFGPQWTNNPVSRRYLPSKVRENWSFVRDVRQLAKGYGPRDIRFDLINEGAPSDYLEAPLARQMNKYVTNMYGRYARAFGTDDVVVSVIGPENPSDRGGRLENFIDAVRATGHAQPRWFEVHLNDSGPDVLHGLRATDRVLSAHGLQQPVVIGEAAYNDPATGEAIASFAHTSKRVEEILQWFARPGARCNTSPPYRVDAYLLLARIR